MNKQEWLIEIGAAQKRVRYLETIAPRCDNCIFFDAHGYCEKFEAAPPDHVQKSGCDGWQFDGVPF